MAQIARMSERRSAGQHGAVIGDRVVRDEPVAARASRRGAVNWKVIAWLMGVACVFVLTVVFSRWRSGKLREQRFSEPRREKIGRMMVWFDEQPDAVFDMWQPTGPHSNLRRQDYANPETCRRCHKKNYDAWFEHPHRKMNLLASEDAVVGDFSGDATIDYRGGTATFDTTGQGHSMTLARDGQSRVYTVKETIGSRFFQYYVGHLAKGPESPEHAMYHVDFVLPFGYWIDQKQWVPVVHVSEEVSDDLRDDPFDVAAAAVDGKDYFSYHRHCANCHSTFALGDLMLRAFPRMGRYSPHSIHFSMSGFIADAHPGIWPTGKRSFDLSQDQMTSIMGQVTQWTAAEHGVTMGVSCGACHLGVKEHAEGRMKKPPFFPNSPHLFVEYADEEKKKNIEFGRSYRTINSICARCHTGKRPEFGAGMSTWNSVEFTDAFRGACFQEATCVHCHEPHKPIGKTWTRTPAQDDAMCIQCHKRFVDDRLLVAHTHHKVGSSGSRCMDCHMPRLNEGLQDIVRTHLIYNPTNADMIESNEPNACNLCHTDKPIDWTVKYLGEWYGAEFNDKSIAFSYKPREQPVAVGWLKHHREAVRLVGADCLVRSGATWALEDLVDALDDEFMLNRQFARRGIEKLVGRSLDSTGYRFYMTRPERKGSLERIRGEWLKAGPPPVASEAGGGE